MLTNILLIGKEAQISIKNEVY